MTTKAMERTIDQRRTQVHSSVDDRVSHLHESAPVSLEGSGTLRAGSAAALHLNN